MTQVLAIVVVIFLILAAFGVSPRGVSLGWLGLAIWAGLVLLV